MINENYSALNINISALLEKRRLNSEVTLKDILVYSCVPKREDRCRIEEIAPLVRSDLWIRKKK
jgi:hypothetical protein